MVGREPRRKRGVREDVLALRQGLTQRRGEVRDPLLGLAVTAVHRRQVLVVDIDTVEAVALDPLRHRVGGVDGVRARGGGGVGRAERGRDDLDAGLVVLVLLGRLLGRGERGPVGGLVDRALEGQERERNDVVALAKHGCMLSMSTSSSFKMTMRTLRVEAGGTAPVTQLSE